MHTTPTVGPELRQLARTILTSLEPALQAVGEYTARAAETPGTCQQSWCPVCALAALAAGEHHPLSALVAKHGAALLAVIKAMANDTNPAQHSSDPTEDGTTAGGESHTTQHQASGYQHIPVTLVD